MMMVLVVGTLVMIVVVAATEVAVVRGRPIAHLLQSVKVCSGVRQQVARTHIAVRGAARRVRRLLQVLLLRAVGRIDQTGRGLMYYVAATETVIAVVAVAAVVAVIAVIECVWRHRVAKEPVVGDRRAAGLVRRHRRARRTVRHIAAGGRRGRGL